MAQWNLSLSGRLTFVVEPESRYKCVRCYKILRQPYQTACGHRYCYTCVEYYLGLHTPKTCSGGEVDCEPITADNVIKDPGITRDLGKLKVHCTYKDMGCQEQMLLKDLPKHEKECTFILDDQTFREPLKVLELLTEEMQDIGLLAGDFYRRWTTFEKFPLYSEHLPYKLAENGWYFIGHQDTIKCALCGVIKSQLQDDGKYENTCQNWHKPHCYFRTHCQSLTLGDIDKTVEVRVTDRVASFVAWGDINEQCPLHIEMAENGLRCTAEGETKCDVCLRVTDWNNLTRIVPHYLWCRFVNSGNAISTFPKLVSRLEDEVPFVPAQVLECLASYSNFPAPCDIMFSRLAENGFAYTGNGTKLCCTYCRQIIPWPSCYVNGHKPDCKMVAVQCLDTTEDGLKLYVQLVERGALLMCPDRKVRYYSECISQRREVDSLLEQNEMNDILKSCYPSQVDRQIQ